MRARIERPHCQSGAEQRKRVQRLAQVMAGRGKEARLRPVGCFCFAQCRPQLAVAIRLLLANIEGLLEAPECVLGQDKQNQSIEENQQCGEDIDPAEVAATHLSVAAAVKSLSAASERAEQCGTLAGRAQREIVPEARAVQARLDRRMLAGSAKSGQDEEESSYDGFADREWLTAEEAAEVLGMSVSTIKNTLWRRVYGNGLVAHHHTARNRLKFRRDDVLALRHARRSPAA